MHSIAKLWRRLRPLQENNHPLSFDMYIGVIVSPPIVICSRAML
jgi:hypothetical protein